MQIHLLATLLLILATSSLAVDSEDHTSSQPTPLRKRAEGLNPSEIKEIFYKSFPKTMNEWTPTEGEIHHIGQILYTQPPNIYAGNSEETLQQLIEFKQLLKILPPEVLKDIGNIAPGLLEGYSGRTGDFQNLAAFEKGARDKTTKAQALQDTCALKKLGKNSPIHKEVSQDSILKDIPIEEEKLQREFLDFYCDSEKKESIDGEKLKAFSKNLSEKSLTNLLKWAPDKASEGLALYLLSLQGEQSEKDLLTPNQKVALYNSGFLRSIKNGRGLVEKQRDLVRSMAFQESDPEKFEKLANNLGLSKDPEKREEIRKALEKAKTSFQNEASYLEALDELKGLTGEKFESLSKELALTDLDRHKMQLFSRNFDKPPSELLGNPSIEPDLENPMVNQIAFKHYPFEVRKLQTIVGLTYLGRESASELATILGKKTIDSERLFKLLEETYPTAKSLKASMAALRKKDSELKEEINRSDSRFREDLESERTAYLRLFRAMQMLHDKKSFSRNYPVPEDLKYISLPNGEAALKRALEYSQKINAQDTTMGPGFSGMFFKEKKDLVDIQYDLNVRLGLENQMARWVEEGDKASALKALKRFSGGKKTLFLSSYKWNEGNERIAIDLSKGDDAVWKKLQELNDRKSQPNFWNLPSGLESVRISPP